MWVHLSPASVQPVLIGWQHCSDYTSVLLTQQQQEQQRLAGATARPSSATVTSAVGLQTETITNRRNHLRMFFKFWLCTSRDNNVLNVLQKKLPTLAKQNRTSRLLPDRQNELSHDTDTKHQSEPTEGGAAEQRSSQSGKSGVVLPRKVGKYSQVDVSRVLAKYCNKKCSDKIQTNSLRVLNYCRLIAIQPPSLAIVITRLKYLLSPECPRTGQLSPTAIKKRKCVVFLIYNIIIIQL